MAPPVTQLSSVTKWSATVQRSHYMHTNSKPQRPAKYTPSCSTNTSLPAALLCQLLWYTALLLRIMRQLCIYLIFLQLKIITFLLFVKFIFKMSFFLFKKSRNVRFFCIAVKAIRRMLHFSGVYSLWSQCRVSFVKRAQSGTGGGQRARGCHETSISANHIHTSSWKSSPQSCAPLMNWKKIMKAKVRSFLLAIKSHPISEK